MHTRKGRAAILAIVSFFALLTGSLATASAALAAPTYTWQDTSLSASGGFTTSSLSVAVGTVTNSGNVSLTVTGHANGGLSFPNVPIVSGVPSGVTVDPVTGSSPWTVNVHGIADNADFTLTVSNSPFPTHGITDRATVRIVRDNSGDVVVVTDTATVTVPPDTVYPNVNFSGTDTQTCASDEAVFPTGGKSCDFTETSQDLNLPTSGVTTATDTGGLTAWANANLPAGLQIDDHGQLAPGTAVPDVYSWATVLGSGATGAQGSLSFTLTVQGQKVFVITPGNSGDEVNPFGNGFDVFQQHYTAGAIIAGWTATKADPATHFVREATNTPNGFRYEAVRANGVASGLCVSDPGGGWGSDPLRDGLILTAGACSSNFGIFVNQSDGTVKNAVTGLFVSPNGTGAQLRGTVAPTPWGGSKYAWVDEQHLP